MATINRFFDFLERWMVRIAIGMVVLIIAAPATSWASTTLNLDYHDVEIIMYIIGIVMGASLVSIETKFKI